MTGAPIDPLALFESPKYSRPTPLKAADPLCAAPVWAG